MEYENLTPQYRIEEYLEAIVEGWAEATQYPYPDYPSWRLEEFLDAFITYIWEDGDHPRHPCPEPTWRIEECLRAIYDVMTGAATPWAFPTPTNRIEEYLAAIHAYLADGTELPVPEPVWRIEQWLAYALDAVKQGGGVATTVSGTMVHITNALAKAALSVLASIEPIQDLHGYDHPWPGGGNVNKFDEETVVGRWNNANGTFNASATEWTSSENPIPVVAGQSNYINMVAYRIYYDANMGYVGYDASGTNVATTPADAAYMHISQRTSEWPSNVIVAISSTVVQYSPYSNICPISGWTGAKIVRAREELANVGTATLGVRLNTEGQVYNDASCFAVLRFEVEVGKTYIKNSPTADAYHRYCTYDANNHFIRKVDNSNTITIESGEKYLRFCGYQSELPFVWCVDEATLQLVPYDWTSEAGTVYGGTLDVVSGELTVDRAMVDLGDFTWELWPGYSSVFRTAIPSGCKLVTNNTVPDWLSSIYKVVKGTDIATNNATIGMLHQTYLTAHNDSYTDAAAFKTAMDGVQLVYELATPLTYQLSAQEVQMLLGENYVWSSSGDTVSVTYYAEGNANPLQSLNILLGGNYSNPKTADDVSDKEALEIILGGNK